MIGILIEMTFGEWLRKHRRAVDLTQEEAAKRAGLSRAMWAKLESGESGTRRDNIPGIARALQTSLRETYQRAGFAPDPDDRTENGVDDDGGKKAVTTIDIAPEEMLKLLKQLMQKMTLVEAKLEHLRTDGTTTTEPLHEEPENKP